MTEPLRSQRFDPTRHDTASFTCGESSLDTWLRQLADDAHRRGTARTWVWVTTDGRVVGYYALAAHKVARAQVPTRIGRGGPAEIPAVLLARVALDHSVQGKGLGAVIVADALQRVLVATQSVAARVVVADAISERAATFYEALGFRRVPGSLRLVQRIADIAAAFD